MTIRNAVAVSAVALSLGLLSAPMASANSRIFSRPTMYGSAAGYARPTKLASRANYRVSRCEVCLPQLGPNFFSSMRSGSLRRFLRVM